MKELKVRLTLKNELLGSQPGNPELHADYIASKAPDYASMEEEIAAIGVDAEIEKSMTVFHRKDDVPCIMDYMVIGFFKSAAQYYNRMTESEVYDICKVKLPPIKAFKKEIGGMIFVYNDENGTLSYGDPGSRFLKLVLPEGAEIGSRQRPLRAQTPQGDRVALANSESVPAGTTITFTIRVLSDKLTKYVEGWMVYGKYKGLGQWRNSGKGSFTFEKIGDWYTPEE